MSSAPVTADSRPLARAQPPIPWWAYVVAALAYFAASEFGWAVWLTERHVPSLAIVLGVYLAAALAFPRRRLALAGLLLVTALSSQVLLHGISLLQSIGYFVLQTAAVFALVAASRRHPYDFGSIRGVFIFAGITALVCCCFVAPCAAALSNVAHYGDPFLISWSHWALASTIATWLIVPPVLALLATWPRFGSGTGRRDPSEAAILYFTLLLAILSAFQWRAAAWVLPTVQLLWAIWAVLRFGAAGAGLAMLLICLADVSLTVTGRGPFIRLDQPRGDSMLRLLGYLALWSAFFQLVGAILAERARAIEALGVLNRDLERRVADRTRSLIEASEALRESESRLALAVKAGHSGTFDWDAKRNVNFWSDELLELYGMRREEFRGRYEDWVECVVPEDRASGAAALAAALVNGQFTAEFRIRRRDTGEVRWMAGRGTIVYDDQGQPARMLGINVDVTERKHAEAVLHETMARKAALLELTRAILAKPADYATLGQIVFSKIATVLSADLGLNYRLQPDGTLQLVACIGIPPEHLGAVQRLEANQAFCGSAAASGQPVVADKACIQRDPRGRLVGSLGASAYACHPLFSSTGRLLGTLSFGSRSRERFQPEEVDFLQTLCHVVAMAWERFAAEDAMLQAKETAERANRAKDEFLAALSHELRTPLNPVLLLSSELLQRGDLPPELQSEIATIRRNVQLEARLIDDLLDLTRITRGKLSLDLQPVSVHRILEEALDVVHSDFATKGVQLISSFTAPEDAVLADATRLQQVFWNVLRNAVKFTPRGGTVTVSTRADVGRIEVQITDTGAGIPPAQLDKIFNAFQQGERGHQFGGLGLGLAIARSIIEMHRGAIRAHSAGPNHGATFTIELPVYKGAPAQTEPVPSSAGALANAAPSGLHILLVEDHEPTRATLKKLLERRRHRVTAAEDLATARELAAADRFDLLLSDLGLPDGDGADLMRELAARSGLPGIALSGFGMDEDLRRSASAGFFAHLVKPVDIGVLDRTMAALSSTGALTPRS